MGIIWTKDGTRIPKKIKMLKSYKVEYTAKGPKKTRIQKTTSVQARNAKEAKENALWLFKNKSNIKVSSRATRRSK